MKRILADPIGAHQNPTGEVLASMVHCTGESSAIVQEVWNASMAMMDDKSALIWEALSLKEPGKLRFREAFILPGRVSLGGSDVIAFDNGHTNMIKCGPIANGETSYFEFGVIDRSIPQCLLSKFTFAAHKPGGGNIDVRYFKLKSATEGTDKAPYRYANAGETQRTEEAVLGLDDEYESIIMEFNSDGIDATGYRFNASARVLRVQGYMGDTVVWFEDGDILQPGAYWIPTYFPWFVEGLND
jgi:hypothetical protein